MAAEAVQQAAAERGLMAQRIKREQLLQQGFFAVAGNTWHSEWQLLHWGSSQASLPQLLDCGYTLHIKPRRAQLHIALQSSAKQQWLVADSDARTACMPYHRRHAHLAERSNPKRLP